MNQRKDDIELLLKANGYRLTHPRETLLKLFLETEEHLTAEEIYQKLKHEQLSLPTVYRNIEIFKRLGIIKEIVIHNNRYFELNIYSQKKLHIHFHCRRCGQIKEYNSRHVFSEMIAQKNGLEKAYKDSIEDMTVVMTGVCSACIGDNKDE